MSQTAEAAEAAGPSSEALNSPESFERMIEASVRARGHTLDQLHECMAHFERSHALCSQASERQSTLWDWAEGMHPQLSTLLAMRGMRLEADRPNKCMFLFAARPRENEEERLAGRPKPFSFPNLEADTLIAGLFALGKAKETALRKNRLDSKRNLPAIDPTDVHQMMDAEFGRKILASKPKQQLLMAAFVELGLVEVRANHADGGEPTVLAYPVIDLVLGSEAMGHGVAAAEANAAAHSLARSGRAATGQPFDTDQEAEPASPTQSKESP